MGVDVLMLRSKREALERRMVVGRGKWRGGEGVGSG